MSKYNCFFLALCILVGSLGLTLVACHGTTTGNDDAQNVEIGKNAEDGKKEEKGNSAKDSSGTDKCPVVTSKAQFLNPDIDYGEIVDKRDGRVYKTVKIGKQTWMAENLNYVGEETVCVDPLDENCEIYGRRYAYWSDLCPEGWHVPDLSEWDDLLYAAGRTEGIDAAMLKSKFGWKKGGEGADALGFSIAPFSSTNCVQTSFLVGESYTDNAHSVYCIRYYLYETDEYYKGYTADKSSCDVGYLHSNSLGLPVRCVKDEENDVPGPTVETKDLEFWNDRTKEDFLNPAIEYGEMTDDRDGKIYKTVQIGEQTWMAENLDYVYTVDSLSEEEGVCNLIYNQYNFYISIRTCDAFGRLYSYSAAMDSAAFFSDDGKGCALYKYICTPNKQVRGICPEGWRLPNDEDWNALFETVGGADIAGKKLKSLFGWNFNGNGTDDYGFSAIPSGSDSKYMHYYTAFWSAGADRSGVYFSYFNDAVYPGRSKLMNIRCVKGYTHVDDPSRYIPGVDTSTVVHATMTDERDGQTYKTVKIGAQTWMAENLNYNYQVSDTLDVYGSITRAEVSDSGVDYGRFYTWPAAMDVAGIFSEGGKDCVLFDECNPTGIVRGVCPAGWHLPDSTEWGTLFAALKCEKNSVSRECGSLLKSEQGWRERGGGFDYYGFAVMPANIAEWGRDRTDKWVFKEVRPAGTSADFWTSTETSEYEAAAVSFSTFEYTDIYKLRKNYGAPVRCVKD